MLERLENRRLLAAGDLDPTFGAGGRVSDLLPRDPDLGDVVVLDDDRILLAGSQFDQAPARRQYTLRRYNVDGTADASFSGDGLVAGFFDAATDSDISRLLAAPDGKIVAEARSGGGPIAARFNSDGTLDNSFAGDGAIALSKDVSEIDVQTDGKILAATPPDEEGHGTIARYLANGARDTSFGNGGVSTYTFEATEFGTPLSRIEVIKAQPDGKILIGGQSLDEEDRFFRFSVIRLNANGTRDTGFGSGGQTLALTAGPEVNFGLVEDIALLDGGKFLAAGATNADGGSFRGGIGVVRYNVDGTVDQSFSGGGTFIGFGGGVTVLRVQVDDDGNAVIIGDRDMNGIAVTRVDADGEIDESFGRVISDVVGSSLHTIGGGVQSNGRIIAGGAEFVFDGDYSVEEKLFMFGMLSADAAPSPITLDSAQHVLTVAGTSGKDLIEVKEKGETYHAARNGFGRAFERAEVQRVSIAGGAGDDQLTLSSFSIGADISGGDGSDRISGGDKNDSLQGNGGRDFIDGGLGADRINGNGGNDQIRGQGGADRIYGGAGKDYIEGNGANDRLDGGSGIDTFRGNAGNDSFVADDGVVDQLFGDGGSDTATADLTDLLTSIEVPA
jgi:uncharacterized delta-60 repeat protein